MQPTRRLPLCMLAACTLAAACDAPDHTTAPHPLGAPTLDITTQPAQPPVLNVYSLTDISGGLPSRATDVNAHGWVVGTHTVGGAQHGFVRHADGTIEDVPPWTGDVSTVVTGINDANVIVGTSTAANGDTHAWRRVPGQAMEKLFDFYCGGRAHANAIDDEGEIAGACAGVPEVWLSVVANGFPNAEVTGDLYDIASRTAVGTLDEPVSATAALVWATHNYSTLDMPYGTVHARVNGVNGSLVMVGGYTVGTTERGFWAASGTTHPLPHVVYGVSGPGRMVGWYAGIPSAAYTIAPNGFGVETPLPPNTVDRVAVRVNKCGTIVGHYFPFGLQGGARAAMWTKPVCD
jgi:probable HAF family extracellular repeat protein